MTVKRLPIEKWPHWPIGMSREVALAYSGLAESELRKLERAGKIRFMMIGPRGAAVALKDDITRAVHELFAEDDDGPIELL